MNARTLTDMQAARIKELEALVYVPGAWRCAKCGCKVVANSINYDTGTLSANNKPQQCPNTCGPMWRITERDAGNDLCDRIEVLVRRLQFMIDQRAWINSTVADGGNTVYQVMSMNEDEEFLEMSGWKMTTDQAIDEAIKRKAAQPC